MKNHMAGVLFGILILAGVQAYGQDSPQYARPGVYIGAGGAYAIEDFNSNLNWGNAPGFNGRLGYRFHPHVAVEAMIERMDAFEPKGFNNTVKFKTWTGTLNTKVFALTGRFQPYGLVGIGAMRVDRHYSGWSNSHDTDLAYRVGVGLDSYLTENWLVNVEVSNVNPTGDVDGTTYYSLGGGIQFRF